MAFKDELKGLAESILPRAQKFLALARNEKGVTVIVVFTSRTLLEQKALWMQGRYILSDVNGARRVAGMPALTSNSDNKIVTKAKPGQSYHNFGLAFDCNFYLNGEWISDPKDPFWKKVAAWAKECGLEWGGNFKGLFDGGHFQYSGGLPLAALQAGRRPTA